jgi:serine/threonine protein kinase
VSRTFHSNQYVGEYRIVEFLGAGGMGEVYRAEHSKIGRVAAVKALTQATQGGGFVERFFNEARIQASLQHPNIATLYDFSDAISPEGARVPYIIMEYVDGQTVAERLAAYGGPLPLAETVYIFEKVCEAIEYVHRHGIIHRDIKSNNIKVSTRGEVKLLDFGIAKGQTSPGLTQVGSVIGTLQYLAPELIRGGVADQRGDIWALGVLLYEMLTGRVPFYAETIGDLCDRIKNVSYTPLERLNAGLPREAFEIISRCLRERPADRYNDAGQLLRDARRLSAAVSQPGFDAAAAAVWRCLAAQPPRSSCCCWSASSRSSTSQAIALRPIRTSMPAVCSIRRRAQTRRLTRRAANWRGRAPTPFVPRPKVRSEPSSCTWSRARPKSIAATRGSARPRISSKRASASAFA